MKTSTFRLAVALSAATLLWHTASSATILDTVIAGTTGNDAIVVRLSEDGAVSGDVNGVPFSFEGTSLVLTVDGLAGNDSITISNPSGSSPGGGFGASVIVDGGPGDDVVTTTGDLVIVDDDEDTEESFYVINTESVDLGHSIVTDGEISLDGAVTVTASPVVLSADTIINGTLDGNESSDLEVIGSLVLGDNVGSVAPLGSLQVSGETFAEQGVSLIRTRGNQDYEDRLHLTADTAIVSADAAGNLLNGKFFFEGITATGLKVDMQTLSNIQFDAVSPPSQTLYNFADLQVDANDLLLARRVLLQLNSDADSVFNVPVRIGPSAEIFVEQQGSGDIVFADTLIRTSGSPHRIRFLSQDGEVEFNDNVAVGQLIVDDSGGNNQVLVNASRIRTARGGANNGLMRIDPPISVLTDTTLSTENEGLLEINGNIDAGNFSITFETTGTGNILNGRITGGSELVKSGPGDLRVTSTGNRLQGDIFLIDGRLLIDGEFLSPIAPQAVANSRGVAAGAIIVNGGLLGGEGVLDIPVQVVGGTINPGDGIGVLTVPRVEFSEGTLVIDSNELGADAGFDQLVITEGLLVLGATSLEVEASLFAKATTLEFIIVDNRSEFPVAGEFIDLPEGAFIDAEETRQITYLGGDGNDIAIVDSRLSSDRIFGDGFEELSPQ